MRQTPMKYPTRVKYPPSQKPKELLQINQGLKLVVVTHYLNLQVNLPELCTCFGVPTRYQHGT